MTSAKKTDKTWLLTIFFINFAVEFQLEGGRN